MQYIHIYIQGHTHLEHDGVLLQKSTYTYYNTCYNIEEFFKKSNTPLD